MKLTIREDSQNYAAIVIRLPAIQLIPGLDNLVKIDVFGNDCLIGKHSDPNTLYLFFPAGTQLNHEFVSKNNLYRDSILNVDKEHKGFIEPNRKIKGLKLRGIISNGLVIPIHALDKLGGIDVNKLKSGNEFTTIEGLDICKKYIAPTTYVTGTPGSKAEKINNKLRDVLIPTQFRFHAETAHLAKNLHTLTPESLILISDKWHGSSCILSQVFVNKPLNRWQKLFNKLPLTAKFPSKALAYITSSGKPKSNLPKKIEGIWENNGPSYYYSNIWEEALQQYKHALEPGISLYGELVGFTSDGAYIQKDYDYCCAPHESRFVVYRITYTTPEGRVIEFTWPQVKSYCAKYTIEHVKEIYYGTAACDPIALDLEKTFESDNEGFDYYQEWRKAYFNSLQLAHNMERNCRECYNKVPAEGLVLRIDGHLNKFEAYKVKSKLFILKETNNDEPETES